MLTQYRRHTSSCTGIGKYERHNREAKNCKCTVHVEGTVGDIYIRQSTHTRSWEKAEEWVRRANKTGVWVTDGIPAAAEEVAHIPSIKDAFDLFLKTVESKSGRNVKKASVSKHRTVLNRTLEFATKQKLTLVSQINNKVLHNFHDTWGDFATPIGPSTTANYIRRLRMFGKFAVRREWWPTNYALELDYPEGYEYAEREPYSDNQMDDILESARTIALDSQQQITNGELETFILVMRHVGMAIIDASLLQKNEVVGDQIIYYRKKTLKQKRKIKVVVPLPPDLQERLAQIKKQGLHQGKYYFCRGSVAYPTDVWNKRLGMVFTDAKIFPVISDRTGVLVSPGSHRFRHTFATFWLSTKVEISPGKWGYTPVGTVAKWLGHSSEATTREYYDHWIKDREEEASDIMRNHYANQAAKQTTAPAG